MFEKKYMTRGVSSEIPFMLQCVMWTMIKNMKVEKQDYLQIFKLERITKGNCVLQKITHIQEEPAYENEIAIPMPEKEIVTQKVYVIDDETHCTMLLAEEY